jgi:hypothetical protein
MSVTIFEALMNAKYNICEASHPFQLEIGKRQLYNAVTLLENNWPMDTEVEPLIEKFGEVDLVPEYVSSNQNAA